MIMDLNRFSAPGPGAWNARGRLDRDFDQRQFTECLPSDRRGRKIGLVTVGLTGSNGGKLGAVVRYHLYVPHQDAARVQEVHIMIGHILCELIDENLKGQLTRHVQVSFEAFD